MLSPQEKDNLTRWDPAKKGFSEIYDLSWSDPRQGIAARVEYSLEAPLRGEPFAMVGAFFYDAQNRSGCVAIRQSFPLSKVRIEREIFYFGAGPSAVFEAGARGDLSERADRGTRLSWELKFQGEGISLRHLPWPLYLTPFPKTKILAPHLSIGLSGEFTVNDRKILLEKVPARQIHLWGAPSPSSWVWGHCNAFEEDREFCFEALSAPPFHLFFFHWEGKLYRFNSPWRWLTNRSRTDPNRWHFDCGSKDLRFVGDLFSSPDATAGLGADMTLQILRRRKSGWESAKTLTASKTASFSSREIHPSRKATVRSVSRSVSV